MLMKCGHTSSTATSSLSIVSLLSRSAYQQGEQVASSKFYFRDQVYVPHTGIWQKRLYGHTLLASLSMDLSSYQHIFPSPSDRRH